MTVAKRDRRVILNVATPLPAGVVAFSYWNGNMEFPPGVPSARPELCVHEFFHQVQYSIVDQDYSLANDRRMTEAITEGTGAFFESAHMPYPAHEMESLAYGFIPIKEFRRTVYRRSAVVPPPYLIPGGRSSVWYDCRGLPADPDIRGGFCVDIVPLLPSGVPIRPFGNWVWDGLVSGQYGPPNQVYDLVGQIYHRMLDLYSETLKADQAQLVEWVAAWANFMVGRTASLNDLQDHAGRIAGMIETVQPLGIGSKRTVDIARSAFDMHGVDPALDVMCRRKIRPCG